MSTAKTLYLVDGHAQIYAAYYAPLGSNLSSPSGEPTKAVYIFTTMILKLIKERQPELLAVVMDSIGPTFRHHIFPQYKANRQKMPEDLPPQIARMEEILHGLGVPVLRLNGYEADDLIGTLALQAQNQGFQTIICSKDKDLEQLISPSVNMLNLQNSDVTDLDVLQGKKGITPRQVVDILALAGDASDNIPGIADVGPKTALQWIQTYQSLDNLIQHADQIKGKRGENLRRSLDQLDLSRKLVTIDCQVPLSVQPQELRLQAVRRASLESLFQQLGFRKLLQQLDDFPAGLLAPPDSPSASASPPIAAPATTPPRNYRLIDNLPDFHAFRADLKNQSFFAIDTETTSANPVAAELVGLSFSWKAGSGYYLPFKAPLGQKILDRAKTLDLLRPILTSADYQKCGQNIKYDLIVLRNAGIELAGVTFDTMVASYVLDSSRTHHNLDSLALDFLQHDTIKLHDLIGKGKNQKTFDLVDTALAADYSAEDADLTFRLAGLFQNRLTDDSLRRLFAEVEMPLVQVLAQMEYNGVAIDVPALHKLQNSMNIRMNELTEQIHQEAGCSFNVDSPKQLADVLFQKLGLKSLRKTKTGYSTDQEVLESLRWFHPVPALMLEYRQLSKLISTYVEKLPSMICPRTGRIHASFNQTVTATGRLSSSDPNLQNIPVRSALGQEIRRAFVPADPDKVLLAADYSQIELRILAHLSQDPGLCQAFAQGRDIHSFVASQVYDIPLDQVDSRQRHRAKAVNFGIIYGQTAYGLSRSLGIAVDQAQTFIDNYFRRYPKIQSFIDSVITDAEKKGYVETILGRRRTIPDIRSRNNNLRKLAQRVAVNTVVQGSAADLIKIAMIRLHQKIRSETPEIKLILQVHDELVFELPQSLAPAAEKFIKKEMQSALPLSVPITTDIGIGYNWLECK